MVVENLRIMCKETGITFILISWVTIHERATVPAP